MQTVPSKSVIIGPSLGALGRVTARTNGEFEVEARNAADRASKTGGDALAVKFSAPAASTVANIEEVPEGRYKITFVAPNPGTYQVTVKMNGEHISGSPFKLNVSVPSAQADMCKVQGKGLTRMTAGEMGTFQVTFIDRLGGMAPPAELDIRIKPEGVPIPGPDDPIEIPPKVQSTFDTFDKDGSGDIDFSELRLALDMLGYGGDRKAAAVLLRRYDADGGGLQIEEFTQLVADMQMAQSTGYLLHGVSATEQKSVREVRFEVKLAAKYDIHIGLAASAGGGFFEGSPFSLTVVPSKASAEATELPSKLMASGLKTPVGESGSFEIQAHDAYKNACIKGGDPVRVSTGGNDQFEATVVDLGTGKYEIRYTCEQSGIHKMSVTIGDKHVRGSPLTVICEPGPMTVPSCEVILPAELVSTVAGSPNKLTVRARDRFGNATSNVPAGINFTVQLRRRHGAAPGAAPERAAADGGAGGAGGAGSAMPTGAGGGGGSGADASQKAHVLYGARTSSDLGYTLGRLEASEGQWSRDGVYELVYVPASRGTFEAHVLCVRDVREEEQSGAHKDKASKWAKLKKGSDKLLEAAAVAATLKSEEVPSFPTFTLEVAPLGPDASSSIVTNASRWHNTKLLAGTRLVLNVELRDRFGNPCEYPADRYKDGNLPLAAEMFKMGIKAGIGLNASEAGPHALHVMPCSEADGRYEARHGLIRSGRCSVSVTLGGQQLRDSPVNFRVSAAAPLGRKCRLERYIPKPDPDAPASGGAAAAPPSKGKGKGVEGEPPTPLVGQAYWISLQARDAHGNAIDFGGASVELQVDAPPIEPGSELDHIMAPKLEQSVLDSGRGSYLIQITAVQEGLHVLTVHLDGQEVIGSPLSLQFEKPPVLASTKVAGKSRGDTLFAVASALANMGINWAFREWLELVYDRIDLLDVIRSAAFAMLHVDVRWAFNAWIEMSEYNAWVTHIIAGARKLRVKGLLAQYMHNWSRFAMIRAKVIAKLALWMNTEDGQLQRELLHAFNTWKATLKPHEVECPWDAGDPNGANNAANAMLDSFPKRRPGGGGGGGAR